MNGRSERPGGLPLGSYHDRGITDGAAGANTAAVVHSLREMMMNKQRTAAFLAVALALGASHAARADSPERACPPGQAVQALDSGAKVSNCIPVPAPVDLGPLNARIDGEAVARMQADQEIRDSLSENGLTGRYAAVGIANCVRSSGGFRSDQEFVPAVAPGSFVQPQSFTYRGTRTFDGGVIHASALVYSLTYPSTFFQSPGSFQSGGGTVVQTMQDHTFVLGGDHTITTTPQGSHGVFLRGSGLEGATTDTVGAPSLTGSISKDGRTILLTNADMAVEHVTTTRTDGTRSTVDRVCTRHETLTKLAD